MGSRHFYVRAGGNILHNSNRYDKLLPIAWLLSPNAKSYGAAKLVGVEIWK